MQRANLSAGRQHHVPRHLRRAPKDGLMGDGRMSVTSRSLTSVLQEGSTLRATILELTAVLTTESTGEDPLAHPPAHPLAH